MKVLIIFNKKEGARGALSNIPADHALRRVLYINSKTKKAGSDLSVGYHCALAGDRRGGGHKG